jgi:hypothetical protein
MPVTRPGVLARIRRSAGSVVPRQRGNSHAARRSPQAGRSLPPRSTAGPTRRSSRTARGRAVPPASEPPPDGIQSGVPREVIGTVGGQQEPRRREDDRASHSTMRPLPPTGANDVPASRLYRAGSMGDLIGPWGNGSPTDSGSVSPGSNPGGPATFEATSPRRSPAGRPSALGGSPP